MLAATVVALGSAVLHASWNIAVKQSRDRHLALWGQFFIAGVMAAIGLAVWTLVSGPLDIAWNWAVLSGAMHTPYIVALARAYDRGDFSLAYPVARGGGALLAAFGGVVVLGDDLTVVSALGVGVVVVGLVVLATTTNMVALRAALLVAVAIVAYSLVDSHGSRQSNSVAYTLALLATATVGTSAWMLVTRRSEMLPTLRRDWRLLTGGAITSTMAYGGVLWAVQRAPVGYVASLRETSVVIAAFAGWKMLDEEAHRRRITSAVVVAIGFTLLIGGANL